MQLVGICYYHLSTNLRSVMSMHIIFSSCHSPVIMYSSRRKQETCIIHYMQNVPVELKISLCASLFRTNENIKNN